MKKYIVVKHNLMRNQKFYKRYKTVDSWSIDKGEAYKFLARTSAAKIARKKAATMPAGFKDIIKYEVEEVEA